MGRSTDIVDSVGKELKADPPKQLAATAAKFGQAKANKQRVAILLSKSRGMGAKIPGPKRLSK